jgi:lipoate---protein ligase
VADRRWTVAERRAPAGELHERLLEVDHRLIEVLEPDRAALVLGSTQPVSDVDSVAAAAIGVDVVRRRSGGGAVLLLPGQDLWVDVTIPRADPLWDDDVARSSHWLGDAWVRALATVGIHAEMHADRLVRTAWSSKVCFAGRGPGEVLIDGRKVVGISQRRTRDAARFQCLLARRWDPVPLIALLALDPDERERAVLDLAGVATGVDRPAADVLAALMASLPT